MAAAVLRSRLPDWEFGQIFGSASVCVFDLWGVAAHFNSIFTSFLTENNRVNGFAWLTFFQRKLLKLNNDNIFNLQIVYFRYL